MGKPEPKERNKKGKRGQAQGLSQSQPEDTFVPGVHLLPFP